MTIVESCDVGDDHEEWGVQLTLRVHCSYMCGEDEAVEGAQ